MRSMQQIPAAGFTSSEFHAMTRSQMFVDETEQERDDADTSRTCGREDRDGYHCTRPKGHHLRKSRKADPGTFGGLHLAGNDEVIVSAFRS